MSDVTLKQLQSIMPQAGQRAYLFAVPLNSAMNEFDINTPSRQSYFIPQIAHESAQLSTVEENFNYSQPAILATFNTSKIIRFTSEQAHKYGRTADHKADQVMIANIAYANRMGNGSIESGEGYKNRGSGLIQLTGAINHKACADYFGISHDKIGDWLRTPEGACRSAGWFWMINNINELADAGDFDGVSDRVNIGRKTAARGDSIGYADRFSFFKRARSVLV